MVSQSPHLVVLNGASGDTIPDVSLTTWVINANFLRRRYDHVVSFESERLRLIRQHQCTSVWARDDLAQPGEHPIPQIHFYDSGNAAIWAAVQHSRKVYVAGADAWMGGATDSVCRAIYPMPDKKTQIGAKWSGKFLRWSTQYPGTVVFVWPKPVPGFDTITAEDFVDLHK
jgi:hypothetical protein